MRITVLGTGLVGSAIVEDLCREKDFELTAVDRNPRALQALNLPIKTVTADLQTTPVADVVAGAELVVCAVPGCMGFKTLEGVIQAGKNVVDISFFPEDAFQLDALAKEHDVCAVVDCGVAPGLCNLIAGHVSSLLDEVERYTCYVGGLPRVRRWPYEYKAVFSPADVLEEYTRPARVVEHGRLVVKEALSEVELLDFPEVGTLEAFNTDGLRSLLDTLEAPFMVEKTLRYPGHANLMRAFRESGFFGADPVQLGEQTVRPVELTSKLLFEQWKLERGEEDITVFRVIMDGKKAGKPCRYTYDLLDHYDPTTDTASMSRTTGYTCAIVARMLAGGLFAQRGVCPPEFVGKTPGCFEHLRAQYAKRHIGLQQTVIGLDDA